MKKSCCFFAGLAWLASASADTPSTALPFTYSLNVRVRYEDVNQAGLTEAESFTVRTRLGLSAAPWHGWSALLEAENIAPIDGDRYSQAGLNPGGAGRAVVADPEGTELNQAWLAFANGQTVLTGGRQRLVFDNARFIGDSGWRQNMQTLDAITLQDQTLPQTTLTYSWLGRINRVFGDRHPQGYWQSNSHLLNASYAGFSPGTLTGYAYWLDFGGSAAAQSCATYGVSFTGATPLSGALKLTYRAEIATQSDSGDSPLHYHANYSALEIGAAAKAGAFTVGHEALGGGDGVGFKTPLATLHAFNGWADLFLTTPATGLRDTYAKAAMNLTSGYNLLAYYHWFATDRSGPDPGREFDAQVSRKFGTHVTALFKYADFQSTAAAYPKVRKFWAQVEFSY
ncbi:MAG: alginate export family protein [Verrucomicrobia bacterium]|nr:alginate export family protein [Verrucomicrobiota bacterium]